LLLRALFSGWAFVLGSRSRVPHPSCLKGTVFEVSSSVEYGTRPFVQVSIQVPTTVLLLSSSYYNQQGK
jgi:hypothetical protein